MVPLFLLRRPCCSKFNRTLDKLVWICLVRLPHNPFINYTYTQGSEKTKVRTILTLWISALFVFKKFYLNQWAWKSSYTFNVKTFFTLFTYAVASDISATRGMKCLFILMSCFAWQVIILLFGWWWRITFLKPITWIVKQLTTSLWQNTWCMRWIELFICFIHFLVWFEHHDWAVTFSLFLTRLTRMIIYGCLVQIFLRDVVFFYLTNRKERVEIETLLQLQN